MSKLSCLLLAWVICEGVLANTETENGFALPKEFASAFDSDDAGITSLASNPIAAAVLKVDKSQYPQLFDTIVSSSIDSIQARRAPQESAFSPENFGFNPIASQSFQPLVKSAQLVAKPKQAQQQHVVIGQPLRYDIRTVHDADYKVYKPEEDEQNEQKDILAALKKNPSVAAYFQPAVTNVEVAHPLNYRKEELVENPEIEHNYKPNAYIAGLSRIRRYTGGRKRENLRKSSAEDEDDPYGYKAEYISKPKAFDSPAYSSPYTEEKDPSKSGYDYKGYESPYSSAYKKEKDPNKDYEYPYGYDSGYDHKEYERIKELSEKQAAEIKQNPQNCKEVKKDDMTCMICKDPKTGGNYESCSYVAEPKNNKYAYSKERKFDSNDEPDEPENKDKSEASTKSAKYQNPKDEVQQFAKPSSSEEQKPYSSYKKEEKPEANDSGEKYKSYYVHTSKPKTSEALRAAEETESSEEQKDPLVKPYNYKKAIPGFYTNNEQKKDVEHVLAEFKKKDRSACKKVQKNGMTCFQCLDKNGLKHEECMFVSESAPKRSHLAYQELKEFTSKPATLAEGNEGAESIAVTTSTPTVQKSAAYVVANNNYGKKLKRKKAPQAVAAASKPVVSAVPAAAPSTQKAAHKSKRSVEAEAEENAKIIDDSNIAPPEQFAGAESQGAFWAETQPRYSAALGVTLPEFMLSRSDHEASFDEVVAGA
ncbi:unnamed protein product [Chilo suppressalis]|uniref:Uncharacterized protein n=1 Tax=Chilo suppressalis TaxID=168631 RepID=A0ABN8B9P4_CHISP|nr:unnamed protein product [Chilo suppressalis]